MKRLIYCLLFLAVLSCKDDSIECIDPLKINNKAACTYILQEVCGCDGKTYANACVAENAGVVSWTDGKCE